MLHGTGKDSLVSALLKDVLGLGSREMVAFVGGGGKTTLMFSLARQLAGADKRIITGTSTKIFKPSAQDTPLLMLQEGKDHFFKAVLKEVISLGHVTVGRRLLSSNKVEGFEDTFFSRIYGQKEVDYVLVEADGANGRPLKAPREHEPVIPEDTSVVVGIIGLDALGRAIEEKTVFALQHFCALTGVQPGQTITEHMLFSLAAHPQGLFKGAPKEASRVIFLNKLDRLDPSTSMEAVLAELSKLSFPVRLIWGSLLPDAALTVRTF